MSKETIRGELEKAEELLKQSLRHEPNQTSFYEGYIKGLKFIDQVRLKTIKEVEDVLPKEIVNPNEDDWYSILSGEALAHNVVIYEIKASLNKLK